MSGRIVLLALSVMCLGACQIQSSKAQNDSQDSRLINVADHGIVPGMDMSAPLNRLLEAVRDKPGITLFFPQGQYDFYPEHAVEKYRAVTNHDNSLKRMAFPLYGFKELTIDGNGSTFMFHGRICPFILEGCTTTTLKNFSIDWETPFHHELKVVERDEKDNSFVAEISPMKYGFEIRDEQLFLNHYDWQDSLGQNIAIDPKTNAPSWQTKLYGLRNKTAVATKAGPNRVRLEKATRVAPPIGTVLCTYGTKPTNRLAQAIHIANSRKTMVENVTVYAAGGMGLIAERSNNIHLNKFIVTSTKNRKLSTRADATHFLGCKGVIKLLNCRFEHMGDDGINVHGAYIKVDKYQGNRTFQCEISHFQQHGITFAEPGDRVMVTSRETVLPLFETTVESVEVIDEQNLVIKVAEVPEAMPTGPLSLENVSWYPDVVMKDSIIRDNRARGALISTKGSVLIENNVFSSQMHGILIEGDNNSWYESGGVRNVNINSNTFENIGYGTGNSYPLYVSPLLRPEQRLGEQQFHRGIRFTNNRVKSFNGLLVYARSVNGLVVMDNVVEKSEDYPAASTLPSIELDYCQNVIIENNRFAGFDRPISIKKSDNIREITIQNNEGLSDLKSLNK